MADFSTLNGYNVKDKYARENYLPLAGGTLTGMLWTQGGLGFITGNETFLQLGSNPVANVASNNRNLAIYNRTGRDDDTSSLRFNIGSKGYNIFGEHNKPTGSYTGNGDATARTIVTGGIGKQVLIWGSNSSMILLIGGCGGFGQDASHNFTWCTWGEGNVLDDGSISIASARNELNANGVTYYYRVL